MGSAYFNFCEWRMSNARGWCLEPKTEYLELSILVIKAFLTIFKMLWYSFLFLDIIVGLYLSHGALKTSQKEKKHHY